MPKVTLLNTLPRPHSVPYVLNQEEGDKNTISATTWLQIQPGISLEIEDYVWERVKEHPDVKFYLEQRTLFLVKSLSGEIEKLDKIEALISGELVGHLEQPIPVSNAKTIITKEPALPPEETTKKTTAKTVTTNVSATPLEETTTKKTTEPPKETTKE